MNLQLTERTFASRLCNVKRERYYIVAASPKVSRQAREKWARWEQRCTEDRRRFGSATEKRIAALVRDVRASS